MECANYLSCQSIILGLKGRTHEEVIGELVEAICVEAPHDKDGILKSIYAVEDIKNTAVGKGVAVPHGRTDIIDDLRIAFGRSETGVEWGSPDGDLVRMVWLIVNPRHRSEEYLNVLSQITKISCRHDSREAIMRAKYPDEVLQVIRESRVRSSVRA